MPVIFFKTKHAYFFFFFFLSFFCFSSRLSFTNIHDPQNTWESERLLLWLLSDPSAHFKQLDQPGDYRRELTPAYFQKFFSSSSILDGNRPDFNISNSETLSDF